MTRELTRNNRREDGNLRHGRHLTLNGAEFNPKHNPKLRQLNRRQAARFHSPVDKEIGPTLETDLKNTIVGKSIELAGQGLEESTIASGNVIAEGSNFIMDKIKEGAQNQNIKSAAVAGLGGILGLSTFKDLLGLPAILMGKKDPDTQAPMLLKAAKWTAGGSMALGALKALQGKGKMTNPTMVAGVIGYGVLSALTSSFENENSPVSKLLSMLGLRNKIRELAGHDVEDKVPV